MKIWFRLFKNNHLLRDLVVTDEDREKTRTQKVYSSLEEACYALDLEKPFWLDKNKREFIRHAQTRFTRDNFIESIGFDYLDIRVIEEDL